MITKIVMDDVACYRQPTILETDKKINLIYGLNGTGKSTISRFLYNIAEDDPSFSKCQVEGLDDKELLVYNQQFIYDNFYEKEDFPGVFTLSKTNKESEKRIALGQKVKNRLAQQKTMQEELQQNNFNNLQQQRQITEDRIWEIKKDYTGGDRVFEYCLEGLKGSKDKLFEYVASLPKSQNPTKTIEKLKREIENVSGGSNVQVSPVPLLDIPMDKIENNELFSKQIVGNENSSVAELYKKLGNSDWVKQGLSYLPEEAPPPGSKCPFCQQETITFELKKAIQDFFDESYVRDITQLRSLSIEYDRLIALIPLRTQYLLSRFIVETQTEFESLYRNLLSVIHKNKRQIEQKVKTPSQSINLVNTMTLLEEFNAYLLKVNTEIEAHNIKIQNRDTTLKELKQDFWLIMRWKYNYVLDNHQKETKLLLNDKHQIEDNLRLNKDKTQRVESIIREEQLKTINLQEAIDNINGGLLELGIDGFKIKEAGKQHYKLVRAEACKETFKTLSEGEKMIISFLYFREICKGRRSLDSVNTRKILVIDDPISSLSHIYIFNIGRMIMHDFFCSNEFEQIFLLTHSLYFFYEMTDINNDRRKKNQRLFRLQKNHVGSNISDMKYEEIQNDYHTYWSIIKNPGNSPALIANCMRNIVEYFFGFVEKESFNNLLQKEEFQTTRYRAFERYMNRESHSIGQNIFDLSEFDYDIFLEAFKMLFTISKYEKHYERMMKKIH
ncbi:AAA family ATPase [uncultured Sphaerochaeta sp.]|uniref:AAA family ATPase n=1 Tax=uncultured Sphaerochaeta sp. TaxID=886478 RepID=UPI0029CA6A6B|nr:AAA family ATPase [uncultured Sphaerochaeta sp.]